MPCKHILMMQERQERRRRYEQRQYMICLAGFRKRSENERARVNGRSPLPCLPRLTRLAKKIRVLRHAALRRYLYVHYRVRQLRKFYNLWSKKERQAYWRVTKRKRAERKRARRSRLPPSHSTQEDSVPSPPSPPPTIPDPRRVGYEWADKYLREREELLHCMYMIRPRILPNKVEAFLCESENAALCKQLEQYVTGSKNAEHEESPPLRSSKPRMCHECQKCFGRRKPSKRLVMMAKREKRKEKYERRKYKLWRAGFLKRSNTERHRVNGRSPLPCLPRFTRLARKIRALEHAALKRYLYVRFRLYMLKLCHILWALRDFFAYIRVTKVRVADMFRLQRFVNILKGHLAIQRRRKSLVQRKRAERKRARRARLPPSFSTDEDSFYSPPSSPRRIGYEWADKFLREHGGPKVVDYSGRQPYEFDTLQSYCYCREAMIDNMIGCDNMKCEIVWFHATCVGLTEIPKSKWYCPSCTRELRSLPPVEDWDDVD